MPGGGVRRIGASCAGISGASGAAIGCTGSL